MRALAVTPVLLALVLAGAAGAATQTIRVTSVTIKETTHDVAPKGASKGDTVVYRDRLVNAAVQFGRTKGSQVGTDTGTLTFTGPHTARFTGHATLPGGTIVLSGTVVSGPDGGIVVPVVGGTGKYANVKGTLTVGSGKTRVLNTYRLTRTTAPVA